ncbi:ribonuclease H-like domain-containing protein [Candidatus Collierbacteria bacterium]|nr:ribonuclease H-like domain-containing protein [Candidatus Collierbacteria bacterium]
MIEVIFDLETKKFFDDVGERNPSILGVSIVSVYRRELGEDLTEKSGEMASFFEEQFEKMWPWFEQAERIVGFNSIGFDVPALTPYYKGNFGKLPHFDILARIREVLGHRLSLDAIAKVTLGKTKIGSGADAVKYWAAGDKESLEKLRQYCEMDVAVTRDVYDHGLRHKLLKFKDRWNELREVVVDFSHPKIEKKAEEQLGLF